jgi:RNA polymerase sigma-70 factor (ECF subfamily)
MLPVAANGQPGAAAYHREPDGSYRAYGIVVLTATLTGIAGLVVFGDPGLFRWFGLPSSYSQPATRLLSRTAAPPPRGGSTTGGS